MKYTKTFPCGCTVKVISTGVSEIIYCPKHNAAPELYEALQLALNDLSERGNILAGTEAIMWDAFHKAEGEQ
jgi:deoxycytidylate deaminase